MKRKPAVALGAILLLAVVPQAARGAGFSIFEQGAAALGSGGAFAARASDPSAIFFNPAGIADLDGIQVLANPNVIFYGIDYAGVPPSPGYGVTEEMETTPFFPTALYGTYRVDERLAVGMGILSPFGLQVEWDSPDRYSGRFISTLSKIQPFFFTPTVAANVAPGLSVGLGLQVVYSKVKLRRHIPQPFGGTTYDVGRIELEGGYDPGFGFTAGARYEFLEHWVAGATYRSKVNVDYKGDADFEQTPTGNAAIDAAVAAQFPPDQNVDTSIEFPAQILSGVAFMPNDLWAFELDVNWTQWSSFDVLEIQFSKTPERDQLIHSDWEDGFNVRAGVEYQARPDIAVRAGYYFDETPQPDKSVGPLLPDADRNGLTAGLGIDVDPWTFDLYSLLVLYSERHTNGRNDDGYDGVYQANIFILGASVGRSF
jgi:long-chain fatty acid transport protein